MNESQGSHYVIFKQFLFLDRSIMFVRTFKFDIRPFHFFFGYTPFLSNVPGTIFFLTCPYTICRGVCVHTIFNFLIALCKKPHIFGSFWATDTKCFRNVTFYTPRPFTPDILHTTFYPPIYVGEKSRRGNRKRTGVKSRRVKIRRVKCRGGESSTHWGISG